jgi:hypothetical protein
MTPSQQKLADHAKANPPPDGHEWYYGKHRMFKLRAVVEPTHTPNGYDPRWIPVINAALEDRGLYIQITDITDTMWDEYIAPMIDGIEAGYISTEAK